MASFCLIREKADQFIKGLASGEIDPFKLSELTSAERRSYLSKVVGEDNAMQVNSLFESKLLLKNRQAGYITWAKKVGGLNKEAKRDLISKIEKMDKILNPEEEKAFLHDLASTKLGVDVTATEAKNIFELSNKVKETGKAIPEDLPNKSPQRIEHGTALVLMEKYINELKLKNTKTPLTNYINPLKILNNAAGFMKSSVSSFDNSFFGRQGIKTLLNPRTSHIWAKKFLNSWKNISKELVGIDAMDAIKADIYSRKNALNGKYKAGGYGLDVFSEEAYPSHVFSKIPLLKNLYKAGESAYNGGALEMRADLADKWINIAEKQGINTLNRKEAQGIGTLVTSMTGRGNLGKGEILAKEANLMLFSIKFLKSNLDTLTLHAFDSKATKFTRIEAAKNMLGMVSSLAAIYTVANTLNPGSIDLDRQSTNFGKIKIFGEWTDITGGMAGMITLASRLTPSYHDGKLSFWSKSATGKWTDLASGKFGAKTALDLFDGYWQGKLSPAAGIVRDIWAGQTYEGEKVTLKGELLNQLPLVKQTYDKLIKDPEAEKPLGSLILDSLGLSVSTHIQPKKDWSDNPTKAQSAFQSKVGNDKFNQANEQFNQQYDDWFSKLSNNPSYKKMSTEGQQKLITAKKDDLQTKIFKSFGFKYKERKQNPRLVRENKNTIKQLIK